MEPNLSNLLEALSQNFWANKELSTQEFNSAQAWSRRLERAQSEMQARSAWIDEHASLPQASWDPHLKQALQNEWNTVQDQRAHIQHCQQQVDTHWRQSDEYSKRQIQASFKYKRAMEELGRDSFGPPPRPGGDRCIFPGPPQSFLDILSSPGETETYSVFQGPHVAHIDQHIRASGFTHLAGVNAYASANTYASGSHGYASSNAYTSGYVDTNGNVHAYAFASAQANGSAQAYAFASTQANGNAHAHACASAQATVGAAPPPLALCAPPAADPIHTWRSEVEAAVADYANMSSFPDPPAVGTCHNPSCAQNAGSRKLKACPCQVEHVIKEADLLLKPARAAFHPDKFAVCRHSEKEVFVAKAQEMFVVINRLYVQSKK